MKIKNKNLNEKLVGHPFTFLDLEGVYQEDFMDSTPDSIINQNYSSFDDFLEDVNEEIKNNFDAEYGINWDLIRGAFDDIFAEYKGKK